MSQNGSSNASFVNVEKTLTAVEEHLDIFTSKPIDEVMATLSPLEKAKVNVGLAYAINALVYVLLKTQGVSSKDNRQVHVKQELERVRGFITKIKEAETTASAPKLSLDKDAAGRFINSALSSDQVYVSALKAKQDNEAPHDAKKKDSSEHTPKKAKHKTTPSKRKASVQKKKSSNKKNRNK